MAEWTNIFELGEWDIYVQYDGVTGAPSPDSRAYLVKAADLASSVGTVSVDASTGEIVLDMQNESGSGGTLVTVVVFPSGWTPPAAQCRVTGGMNDGGPSLSFFTGNAAVDRGPVVGQVTSIAPVTEAPGSYEPTVPDLEKLADGIDLNAYELANPVASGNGVAAWQLYGGS